MTRWTLTILTMLLLAIWLASGRWRAGVTAGDWRLTLQDGGILACDVVFRHDDLLPERTILDWAAFARPRPRGQPYRLRWRPDLPAQGSSISGFFLPLWMPLLLCVPLTCWRWTSPAWRRRRRGRAGCCRECGYDLSGLDRTGGSVTCPECGA